MAERPTVLIEAMPSFPEQMFVCEYYIKSVKRRIATFSDRIYFIIKIYEEI